MIIQRKSALWLMRNFFEDSHKHVNPLIGASALVENKVYALHKGLLYFAFPSIEQDGWMNGVLGHFYALSRLNWARDNLG